jgi:hypothetical protein
MSAVRRAMLTTELRVFLVLLRDQVRSAYSLRGFRELAQILVRDGHWIVAGPGVAVLKAMLQRNKRLRRFTQLSQLLEQAINFTFKG